MSLATSAFFVGTHPSRKQRVHVPVQLREVVGNNNIREYLGCKELQAGEAGLSKIGHGRSVGEANDVLEELDWERGSERGDDRSRERAGVGGEHRLDERMHRRIRSDL